MVQEQPSYLNRADLEFPGGPLPLNSHLYIDRPPLEELVCQEVQKPGSIIRIQAPRKMGKSSLLARLIDHAEIQGYKVARLDFQEADESIFSSLDKFLRWFSLNISRRLRLKPQLDNYWDDEIGSKVSCTYYFEDYLLEQVDTPLVLALNEVNLIFEYPEIAKEFLPLLRFWHEQAKQVEAFQNLRLIIVHSTDIYVPLKIHQSPFNVGLPVRLPEFSLIQVRELGERFGFDGSNVLETKQLESLLDMVGGSPYHLSLVFYYLKCEELSLEQIVQTAPTLTGIFGSHLQDLLFRLQQDIALQKALEQAIASNTPIELDANIAYKLNSLGVMKLHGNRATFSCELYRQFFHTQLSGKSSDDALSVSIARLKALEAENLQLKSLVDTDALTQIANRRHFDRYLVMNLLQAVRTKTPIGLILIDIDDFKAYNDTYGHPAGDDCLFRVASAIHNCLKRPGDLAARYGGEEFAVILPQTDTDGAVKIAEVIRQAIRNLAIPHANSRVGSGIVTSSLGIISAIPHAESDRHSLLLAADEALYQAKQQGRDRLVLANLHPEHTSEDDETWDHILTQLDEIERRTEEN
ncbi:AAA-like domain-containing protein [Tumidithrix elongata RA019]|uniref:AAA-like domain-containing protein n=1 Tax=Tumidithrix elongata BACA0141 TaxID=2716417 RepID=A0AAW9PT78_9CYAN|nr:AAA-like domain-containing protein [Tumidithrix elongata RA019]